MSARPTASVAFAGAGMIASVHHAALEHLDGLSLAAVASRTPERAGDAAARLGVPSRTFDELPAGADGVVIATPPGHHAALAARLLAEGVPVLVEKPLCTTLADADSLVAAVEAGGRLAYAENLVHAPAVRLAVDLAAGLDGIDHLELRAVQPRPTWGDFLTPGWGGGVLFDLGAHPLALALLLAAPARPVSVEAQLQVAADHPVDDHAEVALRFDSGLVARIEVSWRGTGVVWDAQVAAPTGVVRLELLPGVRVERNGDQVALPPLRPDIPAPLQELGYLDQLRAFASDLVTGSAPAVSAAFGRSVLDVTCAAYRAAATGTAVTLPFAGPRDRTPHELWSEA